MSEPHLSSLAGSAAERVTAMRWARYLGAAFGTTRALRSLRYYRDVNWISEEVQRAMADYVRGLPIDELQRAEEYEIELGESLSSLSDTPFERHARSLQFIAAISGESIEHGLASLRMTSSGIDALAAHGTSSSGLGSGLGRGVDLGPGSEPMGASIPSVGGDGDRASTQRTRESTESATTDTSDTAITTDTDTSAVDAASDELLEATTIPPEARCIALTDDGGRCDRRARDDGDYCSDHSQRDD